MAAAHHGHEACVARWPQGLWRLCPPSGPTEVGRRRDRGSSAGGLACARRASQAPEPARDPGPPNGQSERWRPRPSPATGCHRRPQLGPGWRSEWQRLTDDTCPGGRCSAVRMPGSSCRWLELEAMGSGDRESPPHAGRLFLLARQRESVPGTFHLERVAVPPPAPARATPSAMQCHLSSTSMHASPARNIQ